MLAAARGKRTEVKSDTLDWLREMLDRILAIELETLRTVHEHTLHTGGPAAELKARADADRKMDQTMQRLGFVNGGGKK